MDSLNRLRVIFYCLLWFGAFASFAQNEWADGIILIFELLIACTFLWGAGISVIKYFRQPGRKVINIIHGFSAIIVLIVLYFMFGVEARPIDQAFKVLTLFLFLFHPVGIIVELTYRFITRIEFPIKNTQINDNLFLALATIGCAMKIIYIKGTSIVVTFALICLFFYYLVSGAVIIFREIRANTRLTIATFFFICCTLLIMTGSLFKLQHWPGATIILQTAFVLSPLAIAFAAFLPLKYQGTRLKFRETGKLLPENIVFVFTVCFIFALYIQLASLHIMPDFYSQRQPSVFYKMPDGRQKQKLRETYDNFIDDCRASGFVK